MSNGFRIVEPLRYARLKPRNRGLRPPRPINSARMSLKQDHQVRNRMASNRLRGWESREAEDSTILISSVPAAMVRSRTAKVADTASCNAPRVSDPRTSEETKSDENRS